MVKWLVFSFVQQKDTPAFAGVKIFELADGNLPAFGAAIEVKKAKFHP